MSNRDFPVLPPLGLGRRYKIRIKLKPGEEYVEYHAVTALGELKAAAMAALRLVHDPPGGSHLDCRGSEG